MIWNFIIIAVVWGIGDFAWGVDYGALYPQLVSLLQERQTMLAAYVVGFSGALVLSSYLFQGLGWYSMLFMVSKLAFYLGQFLVCLVSFGAVLFWLYTASNLWVDMGYLNALLPFVWLFAASFSLGIFDFNYPVTERIYNHMLLAILSVLAVMLLALSGLNI